MENQKNQTSEAPTLRWYQAQLAGKYCQWCTHIYSQQPNHSIESRVYLDGSNLKIEYYDHDGGYPVKGFKERQWLYVTCPRCQYQWSLRKLGIVTIAEIINN